MIMVNKDYQRITESSRNLLKIEHLLTKANKYNSLNLKKKLINYMARIGYTDIVPFYLDVPHQRNFIVLSSLSLLGHKQHINAACETLNKI